jgi:hypothetical protein
MRSLPACTGRCRKLASCGVAERIDQRIAELQRMRGGEADAADAIDLGDGADQQAEVGELAVAIGPR